MNKLHPNQVVAVIVTFNRQQLLSNCIAALKNQTRKIDKILIINNGSTDNTEQWLQQQPDVDFITQPNLGGAGGFYKGIKTAYELGYSWIWLMDDDGFPKEDALEKLLEDDSEKLMLRNCAVINKDDKKSFVWKTKNYKSIDEVKDKAIHNIAHLFNGTLLHRTIIERVGFPNHKLFLWGDETEYYYRIIKKNAIPFCTITNSIHYHPPVTVSYRQNWDYNAAWKMYYYIRNRFHVHKSKFYNNIPFAYIMYAGFLTVFAASTLAFQKTDKFKKIAFILWPAKDAIRNNFSATPASILQRLTSQDGAKFNLVKTFRSLIHRQSSLQELEKA